MHGCIDGYSRFLIYLKACPDKLAETVHDIFVEACNDENLGWASRVRWDKGTENVLAILAQINKWWDGIDGSPSLTRGSAITGRSTQNCRIEYIWRYVAEHVTRPFKALFKLMINLGLLDPEDPCELFCLHVIFLPVLQEELDDFRDMWNTHQIRSAPKTHSTKGCHFGGRPCDLYQHPVRLSCPAPFSVQQCACFGCWGVCCLCIVTAAAAGSQPHPPPAHQQQQP